MEMNSSQGKCVAEKKGLSTERRSAARELWEKVICGSIVASKFVSILSTRRQTYAQVDNEGRVFWHIKLMFAAPQFALIPLTLLINVFIIKFYLDDVKVSAAFIAFFQIFSRSFDVLTDPMMAHISDNVTHTRYGRRIPYMMLCPLYAVAFYILVSPPKDSPEDAAFWFGGSYLFFYLCDTLVNVPFQALGPELTDDSDERTSLYMYVKVAEGVGVMIGTLMPGALEDYLDNRQIYKLIAVIFGSFYILSMFVLIRNVEERKASIMFDAESIRQPFVTSLYRSMRNKAFRPLVIGWILDFASLAFIATMVPFYVTYYIEVDRMENPFCDSSESDGYPACPSTANPCCMSSGKHLGYCMACFFVSGFFAIPIWKYLARHDRKSDVWYERLKIGKVQAWLAYNVVNVVTNVLFVFVPEGGLFYLYFCMIMNGIPTGGQFLISAILADVIDYDEFLNYKRNEGQFTVFASFVPKIIAIPCQSFPLVGMFILGYTNPGTDAEGDLIFQPQNTDVKWFIRGLFVFAPLLLVSSSFLVKRLYPIRSFDMILVISAGITQHLQGLSAYDPVSKQDVWIEDYTEEEQYLIYLLDQFSHSNLLWLLSPDTIWKRHQDQGIPLRKSTLLHLTQVDDDDDADANPKEEDRKVTHMIDNETQEQPLTNTRGLCSCFDTKIHIKNIIRTRNDVEFGRDAHGNIVYVAVAKFEAHGVSEGVKRIKIRVCLWIAFYLSLFCISVVGVSTTIRYLRNATYAFVPAIFCLMIGLTFVGVGFNYMRYRAANEIRTYIEEKNISDEVLAKCIYPKTKGQRGGALIGNDEELDQINTLLPETIAHPKQLKSLTNLDLLVMDQDIIFNKDDDLY
eukprot:50941_1